MTPAPPCYILVIAMSRYLNFSNRQRLAPLPIAAEIDARLIPHRQHRHAIDLKAVRVAPMILTPGALLREPGEVRAGEVVMMADLGAAHAGEERLGVVRVDPAFQAVGFLVVDPVHREAAMKLVPCAGFVGVDFGTPVDPSTDEIERSDFGSKHAGSVLPSRSRITTTVLRLPDWF
jgi:hypothetical protein